MCRNTPTLISFSYFCLKILLWEKVSKYFIGKHKMFLVWIQNMHIVKLLNLMKLTVIEVKTQEHFIQF